MAGLRPGSAVAARPLAFVLALAICAFTAAGHDSPEAIAQEAVERPEFLRTEHDFAGPETEDGESGAYPLLLKVQYRRGRVAAEARFMTVNRRDRRHDGASPRG
jgi:hypothetical protein